MKILDKYLLTSFLKTFASVFVILFFIFILQSIWLFIAELAGKDLDFITIVKFVLYFCPTIAPGVNHLGKDAEACRPVEIIAISLPPRIRHDD